MTIITSYIPGHENDPIHIVTLPTPHPLEGHHIMATKPTNPPHMHLTHGPANPDRPIDRTKFIEALRDDAAKYVKLVAQDEQAYPNTDPLDVDRLTALTRQHINKALAQHCEDLATMLEQGWFATPTDQYHDDTTPDTRTAGERDFDRLMKTEAEEFNTVVDGMSLIEVREALASGATTARMLQEQLARVNGTAAATRRRVEWVAKR